MKQNINPIFISARFRSGSTLLWNIFDSLPGFTAYYEPLHDNLIAHIRNTPPMESHRGVLSYWDSYKPFLGELKKHHHREFGFSRLILEEEDEHDDLKAYLDFLLEKTTPNRAVFQFNRVDFRLPWLRRHFPEATIIHLLRNPRDSWISARRHLPGNKWDDPYYHDAYDLLQWIASLEEKFPFLIRPEPVSSYEPHYYIWKLSELMGRRWSDCQLDYDADIRENPLKGFEKLVRAGCMKPEDAEQSRELIIADALSNWRQYDNDAYYLEIENRCERVLERLGIISDFGKTPLGKIRKKHKSKWKALEKHKSFAVELALLSACSQQRSETTRLLADVRKRKTGDINQERVDSGDPEDVVLNDDGIKKWKKFPRDKQVLENKKVFDAHVLRWEKLCIATLESEDKGSPKTIFLHIPKSGGTTLDNIISRNHEMENVVHINGPVIMKNPKELFKKGNFPDVVMGHFSLNHIVYQGVLGNLIHMTLLREPISRIISHYNFVVTSLNHGRREEAAEMGFEGYVTSIDSKECFNAQMLRLTGYLERPIEKQAGSLPSVLSLAKENLEKRFSLFGLTDRYNEFILMCRHLLGWQDIYYTRRRVTADYPGKVQLSDLSKSLIDRLKEQNQYDLELYEFAACLFNQRIEQIGITEDDVTEFSRRNALFEKFVLSPVGSIK
jgi:hypothetical protein